MKTSLLKSLFITTVLGCMAMGCKNDEVASVNTNNEFTFGSDKYTGSCTAVSSQICKGSTDVGITSTKSLLVYNMPTASSGNFTITNGWAANPACNIYVLIQKESGDVSASINGTLTKTGEKSFTLSTVLSASPSASSTIAATASGTYK